MKAYAVEAGVEQEKIGLKRASGEKSMGIIELKDRNIDSINVIGVASQYGTNYFMDYLVETPNMIGKRIPPPVIASPSLPVILRKRSDRRISLRTDSADQSQRQRALISTMVWKIDYYNLILKI